MRVWRNLAAVVLILAAGGCRARGPQTGGDSGAAADKARKNADALAVAAVNGGGAAQATAVPEAARRDWTWLGGRVAVDRASWRVSVGRTAKAEPASAPEPPRKPRLPVRPGSPAVISERVASTLPYRTEDEAEGDALEQACAAVERRLGELDPPVRYRPTAAEARAEFVRADSRTLRAPDANEKDALQQAGVTADLVYAEYEVEVTADQVRELRSRQRLTPALRVFGGAVAVALVAFVLLRFGRRPKDAPAVV